MLFCEECGTELTSNGFCPKCQLYRTSPPEKTAEKKTDKKKVWLVLKWVSLGVGFLSILIGFDEGGAMVWIPLGCFFGIVSRIMQAEEHK
ncbi:hypothetical protein M1N56_05635 [Dehalococcoidia bacterium]|nr:hypothetical protein [Dehalococcoidia bacterium]